jgi:hypothetical protein
MSSLTTEGIILKEPVNISLSFAFATSLASVFSVSAPALILYSELRNKEITLYTPLNIWEIVLYIVTTFLVIYVSIIAMFLVLFRIFPIESEMRKKDFEKLYQTLKRRTVIISILLILGILFISGTFLIFFLIFRPLIEQKDPERTKGLTVLISSFYAVGIISLIINLFIAVFSKDVIFLQLIYRENV